MARRRYQSTSVYPATPGPTPHPLLSAIISAMVTIAILYIITSTLGPVNDYFGLMVASQPAEAAPYANSVLPLFRWSYLFIVATGIVSFVGIWLAIARSITYSRYGD